MTVFPEEGQVCRSAYGVHLHVVFIVSFIAVSRLSNEAVPDTPLVLESAIRHLVHAIIKKEIKL